MKIKNAKARQRTRRASSVLHFNFSFRLLESPALEEADQLSSVVNNGD
jgi:hypothetical protein